MPTKFVTNPRRPAAKKSRVPMRRNYARASAADNYLRDLRPAQVAQMVREGSLAITHADIGNDYHTVTLFEEGAGENRKRVEAKWFVPGEEWYNLSLGLRDGKVDPSTADLFLGPSGWDKREREEQTRAAAKRKGIDIDASRHYFNNPRRNPSDIVPGLRIGRYVVQKVRENDVIVLRRDEKGDGDYLYRVEVTTLADLKRELAERDKAQRRFLEPAYERNPSPFGEDYVEKVYGDWGAYSDVRAKELASLAKAFGGTAKASTVRGGGKKVVVRFSKHSWWASTEAFKPFAEAFAVWDARRAQANTAWHNDGPHPDTLDLVSDLLPTARRKNPDAATPRAFLSVLRSKLTQHDVKLSAKQPNMYRLGHYLAAAERVEKDMGKSLDSTSPAALHKLRQSLHKRFEMPFAPASAVERQIDAYLTKDTMPSLVRKNPSFKSPHGGPSIKRMMDFLNMSKADAQMLKAKMDAGDTVRSILSAADRILNGYGVESIPGVGGALSYVNMGDTYHDTLIFDRKTNRFVVSSWGDIVERQPRRFED